MDPWMTSQAVQAARRVVIDHGLACEHAEVLQSSNRVTVRFEPARVIARVAPSAARAIAEREVDLVRQLDHVDAPVAPLDARFRLAVHEAGEFIVTLWVVCTPVSPAAIEPAEYATALGRLHAGLRLVEGADIWPTRFADRVEQALRLIHEHESSDVLAEADRQLVEAILRDAEWLVASDQQLLHGEPHPANLMRTADGIVFFDFETCCRGPVEFDLAHGVGAEHAPPVDLAQHHPGADPDLVRACWRTALALAIAWRYDPDDDLPNGRARVRRWMDALRACEPPRSTTPTDRAR